MNKLLISLLLLTSSCSTPFINWTMNNTYLLREGPGTEYLISGIAYDGEKVVVVEVKNDRWALIVTDSGEGWIKMDSISYEQN